MEIIKRKKKKDVGAIVFIVTMMAIPVISFLFFYVYINFNSILMAFQEPNFRDGGFTWGFGNFVKFYEKFSTPGVADNLGLCLLNTVIYFCEDMFVMMPLSLIICYFTYKKIAGYQAFRTIIYLPVIITTPIMAALYCGMIEPGGLLHMMGNKLGMDLPDSYVNNPDYSLGTVLFFILYTGIGGRFVLFGGAMNSIDPSIIDAGKIDGASPYRELVSIIIPCIWPTLATLILMGSTAVFTASGPLLLFDQGRFGSKSISFYIYLITESGGDPNASVELASAVGVVFTVLALPIVMVVKKITKVTEAD